MLGHSAPLDIQVKFKLLLPVVGVQLDAHYFSAVETQMYPRHLVSDHLGFCLKYGDP